MQLHELKPEHEKKEKKRKGRGKKHGMYSGRGIKGQKARAGHKLQPVIRRFIKRYPKKRGYRFKSRKKKPEVVNVKDLERAFKKGEEVSPRTLLKKGMVDRRKGRLPEVKVLGKGDLKKPLVLKEVRVSEGAEEKIKEAGGEIVE